MGLEVGRWNFLDWKGGDPNYSQEPYSKMILPSKTHGIPWGWYFGWFIGAFRPGMIPPRTAPRHGAFGASTTRLEGSAIDAQQDGIGACLVGGCWEVGRWWILKYPDKSNPKNNPTKNPVKGHVGFLGLCWAYFLYWIWTLDGFRKLLLVG